MCPTPQLQFVFFMFVDMFSSLCFLSLILGTFCYLSSRSLIFSVAITNHLLILSGVVFIFRSLICVFYILHVFTFHASFFLQVFESTGNSFICFRCSFMLILSCMSFVSLIDSYHPHNRLYFSTSFHIWSLVIRWQALQILPCCLLDTSNSYKNSSA